jgi:hypothetical protein
VGSGYTADANAAMSAAAGVADALAPAGWGPRSVAA